MEVESTLVVFGGSYGYGLDVNSIEKLGTDGKFQEIRINNFYN